MFCRKRLLPVVLTASFPPGRITFVPILAWAIRKMKNVTRDQTHTALHILHIAEMEMAFLIPLIPESKAELFR
jgi:hypothetical protein